MSLVLAAALMAAAATDAPESHDVAVASAASAYAGAVGLCVLGVGASTAVFFIGPGFTQTTEMLALPAIGLLVGGAGGAFVGATAAGADRGSSAVVAGSAAAAALVGSLPGVAIVAYAADTYSDGGYGSLTLVITGLVAIGGGLAVGAGAGAAIASYVVTPAVPADE